MSLFKRKSQMAPPAGAAKKTRFGQPFFVRHIRCSSDKHHGIGVGIHGFLEKNFTSPLFKKPKDEKDNDYVDLLNCTPQFVYYLWKRDGTAYMSSNNIHQRKMLMFGCVGETFTQEQVGTFVTDTLMKAMENYEAFPQGCKLLYDPAEDYELCVHWLDCMDIKQVEAIWKKQFVPKGNTFAKYVSDSADLVYSIWIEGRIPVEHIIKYGLTEQCLRGNDLTTYQREVLKQTTTGIGGTSAMTPTASLAGTSLGGTQRNIGGALNASATAPTPSVTATHTISINGLLNGNAPTASLAASQVNANGNVAGAPSAASLTAAPTPSVAATHTTSNNGLLNGNAPTASLAASQVNANGNVAGAPSAASLTAAPTPSVAATTHTTSNNGLLNGNAPTASQENANGNVTLAASAANPADNATANEDGSHSNGDNPPLVSQTQTGDSE